MRATRLRGWAIRYRGREPLLISTLSKPRAAIILPPMQEAGYHQIEIGPLQLRSLLLRRRCVTISDITAGRRVWGLAAQIYGLRSPGDCGIGDMAGAVALGRAAAALQADALALSPTHALFAADPNHFSPYSPSSRIFYNPLHADAAAIFGEVCVLRKHEDEAAVMRPACGTKRD